MIDVVALKSHPAFQSELWLIRRFNRLKSQPFLEFKTLLRDAVVKTYSSLFMWHLFLVTKNARNSNQQLELTQKSTIPGTHHRSSYCMHYHYQANMVMWFLFCDRDQNLLVWEVWLENERILLEASLPYLNSHLSQPIL